MKIEGYFSGIKNANIAVEKLKKAGYLKTVSDLNEHYSVRSNNFVQSGRAQNPSSLSSLVLDVSGSLGDPDKGPLLAASPMASGMGNFKEIADVNYKVIVEADDKEGENIKGIISDMGGTLNNPNFQLPKGIENIPTSNVLDKLDLNGEEETHKEPFKYE
ncbi:MAG: hypothetical protein H7Y18_11160 [Clostridiaceae bacterium]|nr:hypothetical protein [Clostridiaceae bacterium]